MSFLFEALVFRKEMKPNNRLIPIRCIASHNVVSSPRNRPPWHNCVRIYSWLCLLWTLMRPSAWLSQNLLSSVNRMCCQIQCRRNLEPIAIAPVLWTASVLLQKILVVVLFGRFGAPCFPTLFLTVSVAGMNGYRKWVRWIRRSCLVIHCHMRPTGSVVALSAACCLNLCQRWQIIETASPNAAATSKGRAQAFNCPTALQSVLLSLRMLIEWR